MLSWGRWPREKYPHPTPGHLASPALSRSYRAYQVTFERFDVSQVCHEYEIDTILNMIVKWW